MGELAPAPVDQLGGRLSLAAAKLDEGAISFKLNEPNGVVFAQNYQDLCNPLDAFRKEHCWLVESYKAGQEGLRGQVSLRLYAMRKPVIAAINGAAVGVGITMTLPMDVRIAADSAKIGFVFTRRGIVPVGILQKGRPIRSRMAAPLGILSEALWKVPLAPVLGGEGLG